LKVPRGLYRDAVAANAYYLSLASASAEEAAGNTETIEEHPGDDRSRR